MRKIYWKGTIEVTTLLPGNFYFTVIDLGGCNFFQKNKIFQLFITFGGFFIHKHIDKRKHIKIMQKYKKERNK